MLRCTHPVTVWLAVLLTLAAGAAWAQTPTSARARAAGVSESGVDFAPVVVDGRVLFVVTGITALPAAQRAATIAEGIRELARDPGFDPATLTIEQAERESRVFAGEQRLFRILDADAELEGVDRRAVTELSVAAVRRAIVDYRAARAPQAFRAALWRAAGAAAGLLVVVVLVVSAGRAVRRRVERRLAERARGVAIGSYELVRAERLWGFVRASLRILVAVVVAACVFFFLRRVLELFPATRAAASQLDDWVLAPLVVLGRGMFEKLPDLVFLAVLFVLVRYLLTLVRHFFAAVGRGDVVLSGFDRDWAAPTYKLVRLAVVAFALVVAFPYIPGSGSAAFRGVSIFLGVLFSIGSTSSMANTLAGFSLTYRRAFRLGDRVKIGGVVGDVTEVRLQATHLRTPKNEEVVIPNSTILGSEVVNYSTLAAREGLLLHTTVGIGYETPWRQVEAMLLEAARRTAGLRAEPAPFVLQLALADYAVTYELNVAIDRPAEMPRMYTELHRNILDVFNEYGVQIMTPAYRADTPEPKLVPKDQWYAAPAARAPEGI